MHTIADKINFVLARQRMLKRDLARVLGVAPQTVTDICKGRSAVTLPHLRKLCEKFELRADFWLDGERLEPGPADRLQRGSDQHLAGLAELGLLTLDDPAGFVRRLIELASTHRAEWLRRFGPPTADVARLLGMPAAPHAVATPLNAAAADELRGESPRPAQRDGGPAATGYGGGR